jgi:hypothetical protein
MFETLRRGVKKRGELRTTLRCWLANHEIEDQSQAAARLIRILSWPGLDR